MSMSRPKPTIARGARCQFFLADILQQLPPCERRQDVLRRSSTTWRERQNARPDVLIGDDHHDSCGSASVCADSRDQCGMWGRVLPARQLLAVPLLRPSPIGLSTDSLEATTRRLYLRAQDPCSGRSG
jgi:hypothetical protein